MRYAYISTGEPCSMCWLFPTRRLTNNKKQKVVREDEYVWYLDFGICLGRNGRQVRGVATLVDIAAASVWPCFVLQPTDGFLLWAHTAPAAPLFRSRSSRRSCRGRSGATCAALPSLQ